MCGRANLTKGDMSNFENSKFFWACRRLALACEPQMEAAPAPDVVRAFARESEAWRDLLGRRRAEAQTIVAQCQRAFDGLRKTARSSSSDTGGNALVPAGTYGDPSEEQQPPRPPVSACAAALEASPSSTQDATAPSLAELQKLTAELLRERDELQRRMFTLECKPSDKLGVAPGVQEPAPAPCIKIHADRSSLRRVEGCQGAGMLHTTRRSAPEPGWQRVGSDSGAKCGWKMDFAHYRRVRICKAQLREVTLNNNQGGTHPGDRMTRHCSPAPPAAEQKAPDAVPHDAVYPAIHKALSARAKRLDRDPNLCPGSVPAENLEPAETLEQSASTPAPSSTAVESEHGDAVAQNAKLAEEGDAHALADSRACDGGEDCRAQGNGATLPLEEEAAGARADALPSTMPASGSRGPTGGATMCKDDAGRADAASASAAQPLEQEASTTEMAVQLWQQHHEAAACSLQTAARRHLGAFVAQVHRTRVATRTSRCCAQILPEGRATRAVRCCRGCAAADTHFLPSAFTWPLHILCLQTLMLPSPELHTNSCPNCTPPPVLPPLPLCSDGRAWPSSPRAGDSPTAHDDRLVSSTRARIHACTCTRDTHNRSNARTHKRSH